MKTKKMALGGAPNNAPMTGQQRKISEHPDAAKIFANQAAFQPLGLARRQYGAGTPDYDNYRKFYNMEQAKFKTAMGGGSLSPHKDVSVGTYTAGTYNPATNYGAIAQQQGAAALAAKKAAKEKFEAARAPAMKMAKGGMASGGMGAGQQRHANENPNFAKRLANQAAYTGIQQGRKQFAIGSPERQNYGAFQKMEQDKYRAASGRGGAPVGTYTAGKYNPATSYTTQLTQQKTAADAAKKAAMPVKMANGGMASSASKRGDGIVSKGKTKCKMY